MAAFSSFQYHPFLVDSPFFPNNAHINTPSSSSSHQFHVPLVHHHDTFFNETTSCCVDQSSKFTMSDNELSSVTKNQSPDTSLVVDNNHNKLEPGEQVTQKATLNNPVENNKKRRNRKASFLSPPQSKEDASSGERNKKQRKRMSSNDNNNKGEEKELGDNKQKEAEKKKKKKNQKKCGEEPPTGYIHVRARRGQATDSHSLAERVRREKISERMKMLQRLVPGCDKVTGKALMLDEIINYVQSLQNQVEFLSMKLASVNPIFYDFTMDMDTPMVRPEKSNCIASPVPLASVPQCSPNQVTAFPTANNDNYLLDNSALVSFLQGQRSNVLFSEDAGSQLWDVEDQRQKLFHPYWITNNTSCSFH